MGVVYGKYLHKSVQGRTKNIPIQLPTPSESAAVLLPTLPVTSLISSRATFLHFYFQLLL